MVNLSIIIPAYNEQNRIASRLEECLRYFRKQKYSFEIIVVNDGSTDKTIDVVKKFKDIKLVNYFPNHGKGYAVRTGVLKAKGKYILFSDADMSTPIEELGKLIGFIRDYDLVIASRALKESKVNTLGYRKFLGRIFNLFVNLLVVPGVKDTQCGFKLFKRGAALKLFNKQRIERWAFDVEILFLSKKLGYKIKEVGVEWNHFDHNGVTPTGESFKMLKEIFKIRWNWILRRYK